MHASRQPAQETSWKWGFNPVYTLLFDLYHWLQTTLLSRFVSLMSEPGSIFDGFQRTGSTPTGFREDSRANWAPSNSRATLINVKYTVTLLNFIHTPQQHPTASAGSSHCNRQYNNTNSRCNNTNGPCNNTNVHHQLAVAPQRVSCVVGGP